MWPGAFSGHFELGFSFCFLLFLRVCFLKQFQRKPGTLPFLKRFLPLRWRTVSVRRSDFLWGGGKKEKSPFLKQFRWQTRGPHILRGASLEDRRFGFVPKGDPRKIQACLVASLELRGYSNVNGLCSSMGVVSSLDPSPRSCRDTPGTPGKACGREFKPVQRQHAWACCGRGLDSTLPRLKAQIFSHKSPWLVRGPGCVMVCPGQEASRKQRT